MRHRIGWRSAFATCVVSTSVGLACWTASAASDTTLAAPVVTVTAGKPTEFGFSLSKTSGLPELVTFTVTNRGALPHSFIVGGAATGILRPGQGAILTVSFEKSGTYAYRSGVPGQAAKGMKGRLTVVAAKPAAAPAQLRTALPLGDLAAATPSPVDPPMLEAAIVMVNPEPESRPSQCGDCHYDE